MRGFFLGFPGCEVQSVLYFLKGRTSSFPQSSLFVLIRPCLGKITFPSFVKVCSISWWDVYSSVGIGFFFNCCSIMVLFFSLNVVFLLVGFLFFLFIWWRCFVCIYSFITLVSCSVYLGRAGSLGVSLAGRVIVSFCVGLRCVECRSGTIHLSASLGWVAGLYRFFLLWGSVVVGTVRLK